MDDGKHNVTICECYDGFRPPIDVKRRVARMLRVVPTEYLIGLKEILLTNTEALNRHERREKALRRGKKVRVIDSVGLHCYDRARRCGWIRLHIDRIYWDWRGSFLLIPTASDARLSHALYHEIGHHVEKRAPSGDTDEEAAADRWMSIFWRKYRNRYYWYLFPLFGPLWMIATSIRGVARRRTKESAGQTINVKRAASGSP